MANKLPEPILSHEEVQALLQNSTAGRHRGVKSEPEAIDLLAHDRHLQLMSPALQVGYVRAAETFRKILTSVLRRKVEVYSEAPEVMTGRGLTRVSEHAACLLALRCIVYGEDRGYVVLALDPVITYSVIERMFGGNSQKPNIPEGREPTTLERRLLMLSMQPVVEALNNTLEPVGCFEFQQDRFEAQLELIPGFAPDVSVLHIPFTMSLGEQFSSMSLAFPSHALEPLRKVLCESDLEHKNSNRMSVMIQRTPVSLSVKLGSAQMRLRDVLALKPGMTLKLDRHPSEELPVAIEGITKFFGFPVHDQGALALEITRGSSS